MADKSRSLGCTVAVVATGGALPCPIHCTVATTAGPSKQAIAADTASSDTGALGACVAAPCPRWISACRRMWECGVAGDVSS